MSYSSVDLLPLASLRVLDPADGTAGFCGKLLADLGAEVVKVEPPGGDPARQIGPFFNNQPGPDNSLSFLYFNSGKQSVSLDLSATNDRARFLELAEVCDVIVETYSPGYLAEIGLGYKILAERNPGLIMASVTGFGQTGPLSQYRSCDLVASAAGGQMYVCGRADRAPLRPYGRQTYYLASLFAATGILLALRLRNYTGRGQHIDISMQEAAAAALDHVLVRYFSEDIVPGRQGSLHWNGSSDLFPCRDGHALIGYNREWEMLVELLERDGLGADFRHPAWSDEAFRRAHLDDIDEAISLWTSLKSKDEVFKLGQSMRLPWAALCKVSEVCSSEHLIERGFFVDASCSEKDRPFKTPRPAINFGEGTYEWKPPPPVGENAGLIWERRERPQLKADVRKKLPLEGIRVLDFTWMLAGPYATRILADFGAEVIKVQSKRIATGAEDNNTAYFAAWNRGKLGVTLDLSQPEARDIVLQLVKKCDVVMENFTPRVMSNWVLTYARLKQEKPDLIMVNLSGFGQTGPWRDYAALGPTVQALSGLTRLTSYDNGVPYGVGFALADHVSGLYAALATLAALERRDRTGQGAYLDISEYEATCSLLGPALLDYTVNGNDAQPVGNRAEWQAAAPHGCYRCKGDDRWLAMAVLTNDEWRKLCNLMSNPEWTNSGKFNTLQARLKNADELDDLIQTWTVKYSPERLAEMLQKEGIAAFPVYNARDLANDAHLKERGFFTYMEHPALGELCTDNTPIRLSASPAEIKKAAPLLGEDNRRVFLELLGMDEGIFNDLAAKGIIG